MEVPRMKQRPIRTAPPAEWMTEERLKAELPSATSPAFRENRTSKPVQEHLEKPSMAIRRLFLAADPASEF